MSERRRWPPRGSIRTELHADDDDVRQDAARRDRAASLLQRPQDAEEGAVRRAQHALDLRHALVHAPHLAP